MPYCTETDLLTMITSDTLIQLTDDENTGEVVSEIIDSAIEAADSEIDLYLQAIYSAPLSTVPAIIKFISVNFTIYNLYGRRSDMSIPETRKSKYDSGIDILKKIQDGSIAIQGATATTEGGPKNSASLSDRIFLSTRGSSTGTFEGFTL